MVPADCWARDSEVHGQQRAPAERESDKWLDACTTLGEMAARLPDTTLVSIGYRAADLFELFALEREPPPGTEAVEWLLLTNVATTSYAQALERARWYGARWGIEVFHRTLEPSCRIEDRQLGYRARLESCLAVDLVKAWRIYYLTMMGRVDAELPCTVFFQDPEWKALYSWHHNTIRLPDRPPSLQEAVRWIATKGGFQGRKADGHPGAEVLWHGLQTLYVACVVPHRLHRV